MKWSDVLKDRSLQNLPYKIELNARGQIVMSPASNKHGMYQSKIAALLNTILKKGYAIAECSIETVDGVKVADVAWASESFVKKREYQTPYAVAPEICVEITSPSNTVEEIRQKVALYFSRGAKEVWVCDDSGNITFHATEGVLSKSGIAPKFPSKI